MNTQDAHSSSMDRLFAGLTSKPSRPKPLPKQKDPKSKRTSKRIPFLARLDEEAMEKTRIVAVNNAVSISDIINFSVLDFIKRYEEKHGKVKVANPKTIANLLD